MSVPGDGRFMVACVVSACIGLLATLAWTPASAMAADPPECASIPTTYDAVAASGTVSPSSTTACFELAGVTSGDVVRVRTSSRGDSGVSWVVQDGVGDSRCSGTSGFIGCQLTGTAGWRVVVSQTVATGRADFRVAVRKATPPSGCTELGAPGIWSFTGAGVGGKVDDALGAKCYSFTRGAGTPRERFAVRALGISDNLAPRWSVLNPGGAEICSGGSFLFIPNCDVQGDGDFTVVVEDSQAGVGSFLLAMKRTSAREGCSSAPLSAFDKEPVSGRIDAVGEGDCVAISDIDGATRIQVRLGDSIGQGSWWVIDGAGQSVCSGNSTFQADCSVTGRSGLAVIVAANDGKATFNYDLDVRRVTNPDGCVDLGAPASWSFAAAQVAGAIGSTLRAQCFVFSRPSGAPPERFALRTVSTSDGLSPRWRLYSPSDFEVCQGTSSFAVGACRLTGDGVFKIVVEDARREVGSFVLTMKRTTAPEGCTTAPPSTFSADPLPGRIAETGDADCILVGDIDNASTVQVRLRESTRTGSWSLVDSDGQTICSGSSTFRNDCSVAARTGLALVVAASDGKATFDYSLAVRRVSLPVGCESLGAPAIWSFTSPVLRGTIDTPLRARCYTFSRATSDTARAWLRTLRVPGNGAVAPRWRAYSPTGARVCEDAGFIGGFSFFFNDVCRFDAVGDYLAVVEDETGEETGDFALGADQITDAAGCPALPPVTDGISPTSGEIGELGSSDCYTLPAAIDDELRFSSSGPASSFILFDAAGQMICRSSFSALCTIRGPEPYRLVIGDDSQTGVYTLEATCENAPCGVGTATVIDVRPNEVGAGAESTVTLRGRDLGALTAVSFTRDGQTMNAVLDSAADNGRTRPVRIDTTGVALGTWDLHATFEDDRAVELAGALEVIEAVPAKTKVSLVGRDAFRAGRPSVITVQISNEGNVDAVGAPVLVGGFPAGTTIEPVKSLKQFAGSAGAGMSIVDLPYTQSTETSTADDGTIVAPFIAGRVPGGASTRLDLRITPPAGAGDYRLRVQDGLCLGDPAPGGAPNSARGSAARDAASCARTLIGFGANLALVFVPGGSCIEAAAGVLVDAATASSIDDFYSPGNAVSWSLGAASCALDVFPPTAIAKGVVDVLGAIWTGASAGVDAANDCFLEGSESTLEQRSVASFDPNEIIGPAGAGDERYITGAGEHLYKILFENLPTATAPAQTVTIDNQLDATKFDVSSVRFNEVQFGSTTYDLATPTAELDHTIDLRPAQNLLVRVRAAVSDTGRLAWSFDALDPETELPPEDPLAGFLPPNVTSPEGEGHVAYTVQMKDLPAGTAVPNQASIVFDTNAPIETPVWSNTIDKAPPTVTLTAASAGGSAEANVTWGGADDASGISRWDIRVSRDGGVPSPFLVAREAGSRTFTADVTGRYTFQASALDGAGNRVESPTVEVQLNKTHTLTVLRHGDGTGEVTSEPAGIDCRDDCSEVYDHGTTVTLHATPAAGFTFAGFSGACDGSTCTVTMDRARMVIATFRTTPLAPLFVDPPPPPPPDRDADGVPDASDRCPDRPARGSSNGCPARVQPRTLTAAARPSRDRRAPYRYAFAGRLVLPSGIAAAEGCTGRVSIQIKRGRATVSTRTRAIRPDCSWGSSVSFTSRSRLGRTGRLNVGVRFFGNDVLLPRGARTLQIRAG